MKEEDSLPAFNKTSSALFLVLIFYFHDIVPTSPRQISSELARENNKGATMVCNGPEPNLVFWMCLFVSFCVILLRCFLCFYFFPSIPIFSWRSFFFPVVCLLDFQCFRLIFAGLFVLQWSLPFLLLRSSPLLRVRQLTLAYATQVTGVILPCYDHKNSIRSLRMSS